MDDVQKFVTGLNISRFLDSLTVERDRSRRNLWTQLLIAEIDRFGALDERLNLLDDCMESCSRRIAAQRARFQEPHGDGLDRELEDAYLANLIEIEHSIRARRVHLARDPARQGSHRSSS
jgi:hypothetical protein